MKRKISIIAVLMTISLAMFSQTKTEGDTTKLDKTKIRLHVILPGISIERELGNNKSFLIEAGTFIEYNKDQESLLFTPIIAFERRNYLNLFKGLENVKSTKLYSGIYSGFRIETGISLSDVTSYLQGGPILGLQYPVGERFHWNTAVGAGLIITDFSIYLNTYLKVGLCYLLK